MKKHESKEYNRFIIILWIILAVFVWIKLLNKAPLSEVILVTIGYVTPIVIVNLILCNYLLPKAIKTKRINAFVIQFILSTLVTALILTLVLLGIRHLEYIGFFAPSALVSPYDTFFSDFVDQWLTATIINIAFCGMRFYYEHNKLEKTHLESQLHTLQSQINPHFMFNVLNHIHYYVAKKDDLATTLLLKYSDILRYQLYSGKKETVSLEEEVQFLKNFIDIERMRWEDKINISCSWSMDDSTKRLPSLMLIPLIENAFKHVSKGLKEKGYINILLEQKEDRVYLEVENSKLDSLRKKGNENSGLGLENLRNRLDILYSDKYDLQIQETDTIYNSKLLIHI